MEEIAMPPEHVAIAVAIPAVVAVTRLIAYAIDDDKRWPRFRNLGLFVVFLGLAVVLGWWLLADGGLWVIMHDFGTASITRPRGRPR
jgi:hypothetical protein